MPTGARDFDQALANLMNELAIQFGPSGRLIGILTTSERHGVSTKPIVFVFLNAGLIHRPGPHRLHVRLARELAKTGINSFRVDLGGFGDSLAEPDLGYQESATADFKEIAQLLESELGPVEIFVVGMCSGADNAIRLTLTDSRVTGMVLLDPVCERDENFVERARSWRKKTLWRKALEPARYLPWLRRKLSSWSSAEKVSEDSADYLSVRDLPNAEQMTAAFSRIRQRDGQVLSIFTAYALNYYNEGGQLGRVIDVSDYAAFCNEIFWPTVQHTYPFEPDRQKLIEEIKDWSTRLIRER